MTITGTAVKRLKKEVPLSNWGNNLGHFVVPSSNAEMAMTKHMPTKTTASRTETAELNLNDSEFPSSNKPY